MGRIAQPAALKLLQGRREGVDSGGRKINPGPAFTRIAPNPPTWLSTEARAEWRRVVPDLQRLDLLKKGDRAVLAAYCETWAQWAQATRILHQHGLTYVAAQGVIPRPEVGIARAAGRELRAFAQHFGLTPSSEQALARSGDDGDEDSAFG